jgi:hypothetical protein
VNAEVAELADALASGASGGNPVQVQVLSSALFPDNTLRRSLPDEAPLYHSAGAS